MGGRGLLSSWPAAVGALAVWIAGAVAVTRRPPLAWELAYWAAGGAGVLLLPARTGSAAPGAAAFLGVGAVLWWASWSDLASGEVSLAVSLPLLAGALAWDLATRPAAAAAGGVAVAAGTVGLLLGAGWWIGPVLGGADVLLGAGAAAACGWPWAPFLLAAWLLLLIAGHAPRQFGHARSTPAVPALTVAWVALPFLARALAG